MLTVEELGVECSFWPLWAFSWILLLASSRAAAKISDGSQYYVLLIITDGVISDMTQTKEAIVSVSLRRRAWQGGGHC